MAAVRGPGATLGSTENRRRLKLNLHEGGWSRAQRVPSDRVGGCPRGVAVAERKRATARIASTWGAIRLVPPTATKIRQKRTTQDL